jgi:hypothetical protein
LARLRLPPVNMSSLRETNQKEQELYLEEKTYSDAR